MYQKKLLLNPKKYQQQEFPIKFLEFLKSYDITISEYLYCYAVHNNIPLSTLPIEDLDVVAASVIDKNLVSLLEKAFEDNLDWVEAWQDLWPKGVTQNGVYVRSSLPALKDKMKKFMKEYDYSKETIIKATKYYLKEQKENSYNYISLAHNFIEKNKVSLLASLCENPKIENETSTWTDRA